MSFGAEFLAHPIQPAAPPGGRPWGDRCVVLDLSGGPYRLHGLDAQQEALVRRRFAAACKGDNGADGTGAAGVEIGVVRAAEEEFRWFDLQGWDYQLEVCHQPDAVWAAGLGFVARLALQPAVSGVLSTCWQESDHLYGSVENFLRLVCSYRALANDAVVLHSAALANDHHACLFPGVSGAGKSTVTAMGRRLGWRGLGDDLNLLGFDGEQAVITPLPRGEELQRGWTPVAPTPLRAVCRLCKDRRRDELRPISAAEAHAVLLSCAPYLNRDPHRSAALEALLARVSGHYPAHALHFTLAGTLQGLVQLLPT